MIRDGDWALLDWDKETGRTRWGYFDGERQHYRIDYPVDGLMRKNAFARAQAGHSWVGEYHRIASIPLNILHDEKLGLLKAHSEGDAYFDRWLNDADNRAWRTKEGVV